MYVTIHSTQWRNKLKEKVKETKDMSKLLQNYYVLYDEYNYYGEWSDNNV